MLLLQNTIKTRKELIYLTGIYYGKTKGFNKGWKDGKTDGILEGIISGLKDGKRFMAIKMKKKGIDLSIISEITELPIQELEKL